MSNPVTIQVGASSVDYLDDRLLAGYFEARKHETYYRSLKHAQARRDFHAVIVPVLMGFVDEVLSARSTQALDAVLDASATPWGRGGPAASPTEEARERHPEGLDLLGIEGLLDFETLKSSYRRAALRCHPDQGGSHGHMVLVNEAYSLFHEMLCRGQMDDGVMDGADEGPEAEFDVPIRTARDYLYGVGLLLLEIKLDEWGLDDAHHWAMTLASSEWTASSYAQHPWTRANLLFPCGALAGRLWAAGRRDQAQEVYQVAEGALRVAEANGLYQGDGLFEADSYIKGGQKLRLVLNHRRQAENALRLGLIDEKRYKQTIERLDGKKARAVGQEEALRRFAAEVGFLQALPTDREAQGKAVRAELVPEPDYFDDRLEGLGDDQQAEYLCAFGPGADPRLAGKYAHVRLSSLLRSMVLHPQDVDLCAIERECRELADFRGGATGDSFSQVADVARFLNDLGPDERQTRLDVLRELDDKSGDEGLDDDSLDLSSESSRDGSTFRARPAPDYLDMVRLPLDRLQLAQRTGSTKTKQEERDERRTWDRDMEQIDSLRQGENYKAAWSALDRAKEAPDEVVRFASLHVEELLEHGGAMVHTESLSVGYWIDKITIALVRLKRWDEAKGWLERFFALPERYQKGSSPSEQDSMRKRLERCHKMQAR